MTRSSKPPIKKVVEVKKIDQADADYKKYIGDLE